MSARFSRLNKNDQSTFKRLAIASTAFSLLAATSPAWAHGFGQRFTLPLPFWLYGGAACAALVLSFLVLLWKRPMRAASAAPYPPISEHPIQNRQIAYGLPSYAWMLLNSALMLLAIVSGWFGSQHAASNFSMTWFWIYFLLGFFYIAAFAGQHYQLLNPWWCAIQLWRSLRVRLHANSGNARSRNADDVSQRNDPTCNNSEADGTTANENTTNKDTALNYNSGSLLSSWPAFAGYMLLIELELFGHASPQRLSIFLAAYTLLWLVVSTSRGSAVWLRNFDTFSALFEHISRMRSRTDHSRLLAPIGAAAQMLICAMLASTAFDALRESVPWATELWKLLLTLFPQNSTNPLAILAALSETYRNAEMVAWLIMPFIYFALMALMVGASRYLAAVSHPFSYDMSLAALALLPLVLGYHVAHYFPLLLSEGPNIIHLLSDPLGEGWNLFGTASLLRAPIMLETDTVWHLQVALIVLGHLGGVLVSHWQACQIHATQRAVLLSQLPMLVWMMGLTTWGLWILSQPMKV